jgi:rubrerythrin
MSDLQFSNKEGVLKYAMQMEKDGMEFYAEAAKSSSQALGRNLFLSLIEDEKKHYEWLDQILKGAETAKGATPPSEAKKVFENIFTEARKESGGSISGSKTDLDAISRALDMERLGYKFYKKAAADSPNAGVTQLCEKLAQWENNHFQMLCNARDYLTNPQEWFSWEEGAILDGGGMFA